MKMNPFQAQLAGRTSSCWPSLLSRSRLQLATLVVVAWICGTYFGSNVRVNLQAYYGAGRGTGIVRYNTRQRNETRGFLVSVKNFTITSEETPVSRLDDGQSRSANTSNPEKKVALSLSQQKQKTLPVAEPTTMPTVATSEQPAGKPCSFPVLDPFDPSLENVLTRHGPLSCSSGVPNVVYVEDDTIKIDPAKVDAVLKNVSQFDFCQYKVIEMKKNSDSKVTVTATSAPFNVSIKVNSSAENVRVECFDTKKKVISRSYFAFIRVDEDRERVYRDSYKVHLDKHKPAETLSVLMVGVDGLAKQHFARAMPKTRAFLVDELGALEMNKHTKLGYSTSPNVVPLLTGRTNEELANHSLWRFDTRGWMDQINEAFVWSDARRLGYRTGLIFDQVYITAFHYLRRGYSHRPVDHYMRPVVVDSMGDSLMRKSNRQCYGDQAEITKLYDYWLQLLRHYNSTESNQKPFFAYSFLARLTHDDYNKAFAGDELYLKFLKELKSSNALNNTVLVWFSDHGERFGKIRHTYHGIIETNTPYLFFAFPPWFEKKYPDVMRVFRTNQDRLTSHYDTYATLQDLINFQGVAGPRGTLGERSISLFREIPELRTCADAQIPGEYCVCAGLSKAELAPGLDFYLGTVMLEKIGAIVKKEKKKCATLRLGAIESVLEEEAGGGAEARLTGVRTFRVGIMTEPGNARFEATLTFVSGKNTATVVGEVARTNMYRGQSDCVDTVEMRRYCYCKNLLDKPDS